MARYLRSLLLSMMLAWSSAPVSAAPAGYARLLETYNAFRELAEPPVRDGVADFGPEAIAFQHADLRKLMNDLAAIDDSDWPIAYRVDYMLVLAEMRGLDFQHRVLQPWARDPSFYSTLKLGFGPGVPDAIDLPVFPISDEAALDIFHGQLKRAPEMLARARNNLTDMSGDLIGLGIAQKKIERNLYHRFVDQLSEHHPALVPAAEETLSATTDFIAWLETQQDKVPARAGIGKENFDWYLKHVLLFPYTWKEMRLLGEREYERSLAFLKIEENEHRDVPMIDPVDSLEGFEALRFEADEALLDFLTERNIMTVPDYLIPPVGEGPYLMPVDRDPATPDPFTPPVKRNFFRETEDRDPRPLRAHNVPGHLLDSMMRARDDRPVRGDERLYFIDSSRVEGWAFYLEEMLLQAGFLDDRPKAREIHYILQIKRAARIAPELLMHSNDWTLDDALQSLTSRTPYWMELEDDTAIYDLGLYLRQPGLGVNYYFGKLQIEQLLSERAEALGDDFDLKEFHDQFLAAGVIPIALIRWEMTGKDDQVKSMR